MNKIKYFLHKYFSCCFLNQASKNIIPVGDFNANTFTQCGQGAKHLEPAGRVPSCYADPTLRSDNYVGGLRSLRSEEEFGILGRLRRGQAWLQGKESLSRNRHIERILRGRNIALRELLLDLFENGTGTHRTRSVLQRRSRENIAELCARELEARGADVGDVVRNRRNISLGAVKACQ